MKSFLLLILSLMITGWEASSEVKGCTDGWVEFTCKYPKNNTYSSVDVVKDNQTIIETTQKNVRQTKGRFSVYNDGKNKSLRVVIKPLQQEDSGEYECKFDQESDPANEVDLRVDDGCQPQFNQTAYRTAKTTISCDKRNNSGVMFFCKENGSICEDISNGSFTLPETSSSFNMSISNVSSQHAGVYWCGVETNNGSNRAALRKIQLEVEGPPTTLNSSTISTSPHPVPTSASSTQSTTASAHSDGPPTTSSPGASSLPGTISVVVCVTVLLVLLIMVRVWKRFQRSENTRTGEQKNEDGAYEEIQERPQKPDSGTALNNIYVTANAPTNPSASQHYSTVNFPNSSGEASGDTYSTVWDSGHCPAQSAVNHPSRLPEDPFYSTVNKPQQH
ncbi:uncharacterized protein LOC120557797 isoform X2 [Perca fluviatilis]|uniref:uncharacterized protein LOC120557797 isoform X2 n=1 Tax=Perca fluviatilis TaxID=8168 RepID=UPI00196395ED|nr:uncharacterized protein LOC120557797 isoform X2 [Perca fluviatilis]